LPKSLLLGAAIACIITVGFILLVVPGIYWAGTLPLAFVALVVDDTDVPQAMTISRGLIKGHWWSAATLISYVVLIELAAYLIDALLTGGAGAALGIKGAGMLTISQLPALATDTLIAPLSSAVYVAMYHHLKRRQADARNAAGSGAAMKR
jgi:hypothetical protein